MKATFYSSSAISIHALVKRATRFIVYIITYQCISIHALVKRATDIKLWDTRIKNISIHALVKRATPRSSNNYRSIYYFNPRPREEGDPAPARGSANPNDFNPRPREEGDWL